MQCPNIKQFPPPPSEKTGWPWTEASPHLPPTMPDGSHWPKISIVTPSLNQGSFIEETIRSVLLQGYPDLEYIVIDGGSNDGSVDIIRKYEPWLAYWVSVPDSGQSNAINKGVRRSTGQIVAWINSDDYYCKSIFHEVAYYMFGEESIIRKIIYGNIYNIDQIGTTLRLGKPEPVQTEDLIAFWRRRNYIPQPTCFINGGLFRTNLLDENLHYVMDWDLWIRLSRLDKLHYVDKAIAYFREHDSSKTSGGYDPTLLDRNSPFLREFEQVSRRYWRSGTKGYMHYFISYRISRIRAQYHLVFREIIKSVIKRCLGEKIFNKVKLLKIELFPGLSKIK